MVRALDDLKSALLLSGALALAAVITVPLLLPALPPEARSLPLPLPVFCVVLAAQMTLVYGLLAWAGFRLARARGLEPAPVLTRLWAGQPMGQTTSRIGVALVAGLVCGVGLVASVSTIKHYLPDTLPSTLHPAGMAAALSASMAGALGEEILFRLFLLSLLLRLLPGGRAAAIVAVTVSALAFAAAHAPAMVFLFGGRQGVPLVSWVWLVALNGMCGIVYGALFLPHGIESAVVAHLATDVVWHVASQLLPA